MPNRQVEYDADVMWLARIFKAGVGPLKILVGQAEEELIERTLTEGVGITITEDAVAGTITWASTAAGDAGGDLSGTYPDPTVAKVDGVPVDNHTAAPAAGQALVYDGAAYTPHDVATQEELNAVAGSIPTTLPPTGDAGGDLAGTYPNPEVAKIDGVPVDNSTTAPTAGQVLTFDGAKYAPADPTGGGGGSGDATSIQGIPVNATDPTTGQALVHDGTEYVPVDVATQAELNAVAGSIPAIPASLPPSGPAGGDLGGAYPNPSVEKIDGIPVDNTTTAPAVGQALVYDGTSYVPGNVASEGSGTRSTVVATTALLTDGETTFGTINLGKTAVIHTLGVSRHGWLRLYDTEAAQLADSGRALTTAPTPGTGVLGEIRTDGTITSPIHLGPRFVPSSGDAPADVTIYYTYTNESGADGTCDITAVCTILEN